MTLTAQKGMKGGDLESVGQPLVKVSVNAYNNQAFVAGDVLAFDKSAFVWKKCTSGDIRPFAVCYKDKATTATRVAYVDDAGVYVNVVADSAIKADSLVKPSTATDGQVVAATELGTSTTTASHLGVVGQFIKVSKWVPEGDGYNARTDAADGDLIIIKLL
jgi:hypothetical protein